MEKSKTIDRNGDWTWYFSSGLDPKSKAKETAGVGFLIHKDLHQYLKDIQPISSRILRAEFALKHPLNFTNA